MMESATDEGHLKLSVVFSISHVTALGGRIGPPRAGLINQISKRDLFGKRGFPIVMCSWGDELMCGPRPCKEDDVFSLVRGGMLKVCLTQPKTQQSRTKVNLHPFSAGCLLF